MCVFSWKEKENEANMCPVYQNSFITVQKEEHSRLPHKVGWENAKSVQSGYQYEEVLYWNG